MKQKFLLKKDKFRKSRGDYSRLLKVTCEKCGHLVCHYQKDGVGPLKRMYIDRIMESKAVWKNGRKLICKNCKQWLGVAATYKKENRKCFILFQDVVDKKVVKLD